MPVDAGVRVAAGVAELMLATRPKCQRGNFWRKDGLALAMQLHKLNYWPGGHYFSWRSVFYGRHIIDMSILISQQSGLDSGGRSGGADHGGSSPAICNR